jgi:hypothetical protein
VTTRPDAIQRSRIFRISFTGVERSDSDDRSDARPSHLDVVLLLEESHYFGKAVVEDCLDKVNFSPDAPQPESEFV